MGIVGYELGRTRHEKIPDRQLSHHQVINRGLLRTCADRLIALHLKTPTQAKSGKFTTAANPEVILARNLTVARHSDRRVSVRGLDVGATVAVAEPDQTSGLLGRRYAGQREWKNFRWYRPYRRDVCRKVMGVLVVMDATTQKRTDDDRCAGR
jgi:hypothetical protein